MGKDGKRFHEKGLPMFQEKGINDVNKLWKGNG